MTSGPRQHGTSYPFRDPAFLRVAPEQLLDKYARKITAAHHRAADTFCNFRVGVVRYDLISYERARNTGPRARQLLSSGIAIMILPYS